ncbi:MAG TPA: ABC transporter permease [Pyrinomonadaceae bacterium]|jgi:lipoprotein-releasing system permease protein
MPYEFFLALRYLRVGRGRRGAAQVTALAALVGIACGVAALVLALALANGFRDELQDKILRGTAHLTVMREDGQASADWRATLTKLRGVEGVADAAATTYTGALLSGADGAAYAVVRGVDAESARTLSEIRRTLVDGTVESLFRETTPTTAGEQATSEVVVEIVVGAELAERTGLRRVGDEGWMVSVVGTASEKPSEGMAFAPHASRVRVAGVFRSGLYDYDASWVYVSLATAGRVGGTPARASVISVEVTDIYDVERVAGRVRATLGEDWTTVDWREANRPLFAALALERRTVAVIIGLIMLVASLNITATLVLVVVERRADIAILSALGARPRNITVIFMLEGAIIGALGALAGVALGLAACLVANHFELVKLPADVYSLSAITLRPVARDVALTALAAFVISLLATLYPARIAARLRPATVLRYE